MCGTDDLPAGTCNTHTYLSMIRLLTRKGNVDQHKQYTDWKQALKCVTVRTEQCGGLSLARRVRNFTFGNSTITSHDVGCAGWLLTPNTGPFSWTPRQIKPKTDYQQHLGCLQGFFKEHSGGGSMPTWGRAVQRICVGTSTVATADGPSDMSWTWSLQINPTDNSSLWGAARTG